MIRDRIVEDGAVMGIGSVGSAAPVQLPVQSEIALAALAQTEQASAQIVQMLAGGGQSDPLSSSGLGQLLNISA